MRVDGNSTLGQVAQFLSSKGDQKVLAKQVDGGIELYAKPQSNKLDKFRLTVYDGKLMSRASYKKQLAYDTIKTLVGRYNQSVTQDLEPGRERAKLKGDTLSKLTDIFKNIDQTLLRNDGAMRSNLLSDTYGVMERMKGRVADILDRVTVPETDHTMPQTDNKVVAGEVRLPVPPDNKVRAFPKMNIDGTVYTPDKVLGAGGFGVVVRYKSDGGELLAVKVPALGSDPIKQKALALEEYHIASTLTVGNPNAIGFNKVVPLADGGLALAGELAPHGDLSQMRDKLNEVTVDTGSPNIPPPPGKISKQERELIALTLLKDAASGLDKIKRQGNHIHADVKSQNLMIGDKGQAVVIDFGESIEGQRFNPSSKRMADSPLYRAPELREMAEKGETVDKFVAMSNKQEMRRDVMDFVLKQGATDEGFATVSEGWFGLADDLVKNLQPALLNNETERLNLVATSKVDTWGLGTVAFELLIGERMSQDKLEGGFMFETEQTIQDWAKSGFDAIGNPSGLSSKSTGDSRLDSLINGMLHYDPESRYTASQVETSPVVNRKGVGSDQVRELIKAIDLGDEAQISRARNNLAKFTGTV